MVKKVDKASGRRYDLEYKNYQGKPEQIKRRASRNSARADMVDAGRAHKGDGMDVGHRAGNPMNNKKSNLGMETEHANRSYPRTKKAKKKNPKD